MQDERNPGALFDHEKLTVYQRTIEFCGWISDLLDEIPKSVSIWSQLDRASTSIPLNIAEGNGKWTAKDRAKFFDIAKGSALECAANLDVGVARSLIENSKAVEGKKILAEIVRMLIGLIKSIAKDRPYERGTSIVGEPTNDDLQI